MSGKVLLFCPCKPEITAKGEREPLVYQRTIESVFAQDYPVFDAWFSKGDNPHFDNNGRHNICHNYNKARRLALADGYDYLFTVEADMIIPPDALTKLLAVDSDVAYGLYCFRINPTWSAFVELRMDYGRSLKKTPELARLAWGKTIDVAGIGMGCTLIKRRVLEALEFRTDEHYPQVHNDWTFAVDVRQAGFTQKCDLSVVCGHIAAQPEPRIIWPDPEKPNLYKLEFVELEGLWPMRVPQI